MTRPFRFWKTVDKDGVTINLQQRRPSRTMGDDAVTECVGMTADEYKALQERSQRLALLDAKAQSIGGAS